MWLMFDLNHTLTWHGSHWVHIESQRQHNIFRLSRWWPRVLLRITALPRTQSPSHRRARSFQLGISSSNPARWSLTSSSPAQVQSSTPPPAWPTPAAWPSALLLPTRASSALSSSPLPASPSLSSLSQLSTHSKWISFSFWSYAVLHSVCCAALKQNGFQRLNSGF